MESQKSTGGRKSERERRVDEKVREKQKENKSSSPGRDGDEKPVRKKLDII